MKEKLLYVFCAHTKKILNKCWKVSVKILDIKADTF